MRRRRRRRNRVGSSLEKSAEISRSLQAYYVSAILFGLWAPFSVLALVLNSSFLQGIIALLVTLVAVQSVRGVFKLRQLRKDFEESPNEFRSVPVPKPLIYNAVFWFVPR